jgi:hypothetical protein
VARENHFVSGRCVVLDAIGIGKWKREKRKWETRTLGNVAIDLGCGPLFSITYEVFYFSGVAIDFGGKCERRAKIGWKFCRERPPVDVPVRKS